MSIDLPLGFRFSGVTCGIKPSGKLDLAVISCDGPTVAAGVYTQNVVCAPPVHLDRSRTPMNHCRGVVVNSGNANACTGEQGMRDAEQMARETAKRLGAEEVDVLVMSTGVIGQLLPIEKIQAGIEAATAALGDGESDFMLAAEAILTTDQGAKVASRSAGKFKLAAMAKGAGMIGPKMATMLATVMTDAELTPREAQAMLQVAADRSFNCVRVEGHTSTNDTMLLLASGKAGKPTEAEREALESSLVELCIELAKKIPADGEGATHVMEIHVMGCDDSCEARQIAEAVADSPLVKNSDYRQ